MKRIVLVFLVLLLALVVTGILCRKPIAAWVIEQRLLDSGFSRAEVSIDTLGFESIGGTIEGDTSIAGEFAEGQLTFFIHCPWQEIVSRNFGKLDITLRDASVLIDPTIPIPESSTELPDPSGPSPIPSISEQTLREKLAEIHKRISSIKLNTSIHIGRRMSDQSVLAYATWIKNYTYKQCDSLEIYMISTHSPGIANSSDLMSISVDPETAHKNVGYYHFFTELNFKTLATVNTRLKASHHTRQIIPFLPSPWFIYRPAIRECLISTQLRWAPDDTLELDTLDIRAEELSVNHKNHGKLTASKARYIYSPQSKQLDLTRTYGEIRLIYGATITIPETTPLTARARANYQDEKINRLTASISSDLLTYNHGAPMGSVDLGGIAISKLHATIDYREHPSPWQSGAITTLRANTYGIALDSIGAFLTDLDSTDTFKAIGTVAIADFPLAPVNLPDALVPVLAEYQLEGTVNGRLALGIDSSQSDPWTTLALTATGTSLGIKHNTDPISLSGGEITIHFPDVREPTTLENQRFSVAVADSGSIHAKDITGMMSLDEDANLTLNNVKGTSFGGTVRLQKATIPADDSPYTLDLRFDSVDAADLAALYPDFNGSITGELSGRVPIIFGSKTLPRAGRLQLDENSVSTLRYDASAVFSTDSQRDQIIRTALSDLNVDKLDVYIFDPTRPQGEVNIVIGGTSNKLFNGAPVPIEALNINMDLSEAEEFIFDLLTTVDGLEFE